MAKQYKGWTRKIGKGRQAKFEARITWTDATGGRHEMRRRFKTAGRADKFLLKEAHTLADSNPDAIAGQSMTLAQVIKYYTTNYAVPARYVGDRKVLGLRSYKDVQSKLQILTDRLGQYPLSALNREVLRRYKEARLGEPAHKHQRAIGTVNREMAVLRRILNVAQGAGWIQRNPFAGSALIALADEKPRERVLSREEEKRLLQVSVGPRGHLLALIVVAVETGMRKGELFTLKLADLDFERGVIRVSALNTKTLRARLVPMTARARLHLETILARLPENYDGLIFGLTTIKRSWATACRLAKLKDLRFHDLRHTFISRAIEAGVAFEQVMKIAGHTVPKTTWGYFNLDDDALKRITSALEGCSR